MDTRARWPHTLLWCQRAYIIIIWKNQSCELASSAARAVHAAPDIFMSRARIKQPKCTGETNHKVNIVFN